MTILVTGVTGKIGHGVADALLERGIGVRGASSHPENATGRPYEVAAVDLARPETLRPALDGVDAVFLYPATEDVDGLVAQLRGAGIERVVLLSSASVLLPTAGVIAESHRRAEELFQSGGLPLTLLRPDVFATNSLDWVDQIKDGEVALPYPGAHVAVVHEADVVDAAVTILTEAGHAGHSYTVTGPESLTQAQQIETIAAAMGTSVKVRPLTPQEWQASVPYLPEPVTEGLLAIWAEADGTPRDVSQTVSAITGRPARTFAEWAAATFKARST